MKKLTLSVWDMKISLGHTNERRFAHIIAEHINSNHREVILTKDKFFNALKKLDLLFDEPLGDPAAISLYVLLEEIKKAAKEYC